VTTAVDTHNRYCLECGGNINHLRSDAKCCDANCRKRYNRRRDAMKRHKLNAISAIRSIEALMTDEDLESFGRAILKEIESRCDIDTARRLADTEAHESRLATAAFLESRKQALSVTTAADTDNE
jgi:hypothetical protein